MLTRPQHAVAKPVVFRKPFVVVLVVLAMTGLFALFVVVAFHAHQIGSGVFAVAVIFWLGLSVIWMIVPHSAVKMNGHGVIVDNGLMRHVIPWGDLAEIEVRDGLCFRLRDGRKVGSVAYAPSLGGALVGYRYTKSVARRMQAAREQFDAEPSRRAGTSYYAARVKVPILAPTFMLVLLEGIAIASRLLR